MAVRSCGFGASGPATSYDAAPSANPAHINAAAAAVRERISFLFIPIAFGHKPFCWAMSVSAPYILRSFGFSILPVGLRGTSAKMTFLGRL